jgi:hypothetical protein
VLSEAALGNEHPGHPRVDPLLTELFSKEPNPPPDPSRVSTPGERAMETFVDGAGI